MPRPKIPNYKHRKHVQLSLDPEAHRLLKSLADQERIPASRLVERLINRHHTEKPAVNLAVSPDQELKNLLEELDKMMN